MAGNGGGRFSAVADGIFRREAQSISHDPMLEIANIADPPELQSQSETSTDRSFSERALTRSIRDLAGFSPMRSVLVVLCDRVDRRDPAVGGQPGRQQCGIVGVVDRNGSRRTCRTDCR